MALFNLPVLKSPGMIKPKSLLANVEGIGRLGFALQATIRVLQILPKVPNFLPPSTFCIHSTPDSLQYRHKDDFWVLLALSRLDVEYRALRTL
jgi:hypothetical protein